MPVSNCRPNIVEYQQMEIGNFEFGGLCGEFRRAYRALKKCQCLAKEASFRLCYRLMEHWARCLTLPASQR